MNIICKVFGHKVEGLNVKRLYAQCGRCHKSLKVTYDMTYGGTIVEGDYGDQGTFCWCECGNELCSTNSFSHETADLVFYKCSKCGIKSKWDFGAPAPILLETNLDTI